MTGCTVYGPVKFKGISIFKDAPYRHPADSSFRIKDYGIMFNFELLLDPAPYRQKQKIEDDLPPARRKYENY